ncbi:SDR family oxidoreductase [Citrobacter portucalensis]|uniref:SDR family oxidoreductase n=1 Tax=Citrobacter portucalensis TaxID=1639133 RepID=UPI00226B3F6F|nr:SDR family oxidoreductase [Citrobacter portucalensis]MCX9062710.1 SDR family oxidoreductase [Citrobacter portucalensis]
MLTHSAWLVWSYPLLRRSVGFIDTVGNQAWFDAHEGSRIVCEKMVKKHPVGRSGRPEEVGALCLFLSSDKAGFIADTTILMDGEILNELVENTEVSESTRVS